MDIISRKLGIQILNLGESLELIFLLGKHRCRACTLKQNTEGEVLEHKFQESHHSAPSIHTVK